MKSNLKLCVVLIAFLGSSMLLSSFLNHTSSFQKLRFPYKSQGLTERQAAAHLLSRFTYGATPNQIDAVVHQGLETWFQQQLDANLPDDSLKQLLNQYSALKLSNAEIAETYPKPGQVVRMAIKDGVINKDSLNSAGKKAYRDTLQRYMEQKGLKPEQELFRQFINQKVLRAAYSHNQLQEVMTDFWFNHFNVSITKNDCARFIPDYERDVIRPNALGKFSDLLLATAKSPAMLYYLDNFSSSASTEIRSQAVQPALFTKTSAVMTAQLPTHGDSAKQMTAIVKPGKARTNQGINENYAREVMELHTMGVDGGYTQQDVTQAARVLTGWTIYPMDENRNQNRLAQLSAEQLEKRGFVHDGDFMFNANKHDKGEMSVLGHHFGPNEGYDEGVQLLNLLAHQQATAKFIAHKLAVRFVSDTPPQSLIDKMARTFTEKDGDIKAVLMTMVNAPEFWNRDALREKTKSPFELAIGAVRGLNANITQPYQLYNWVSKMGEKKYYYQAPTGFPDKGQYWINTGSLLTRMNFGLALATGRIPGVQADLPALNHHHEPESAEQALIIYSKLLMPERNLDATIKRLTPVLAAPDLAAKINAASAGVNANQPMRPEADKIASVRTAATDSHKPMAMQTGSSTSMLSQVVGVIIGSPEYQRR